ncbi:histidine kinase [Paenibacillus darwinianus]|uniref:Histidine kinase n=1 Tax=Paenibacillus darwinianus TaxID=1380763 RepID=A0A9W5W8C4_9BACL|nr:sensor histidine kinase [Paenibacillus darwinianus]EXX89459.1 histidine kinase [Paenibacillus darwinianus]EXX90749.1 histidine kinase [Paenibacillus darwinianus]EXX90899.1 histidine kinase [Paenibacillus darwinianus]
MHKWTILPKMIRFRRIRSRFLAAMIGLSLPSIMLLGFISFNITKDTLVDVNEQTNRDRLRTSSEVADLLFRNINNLHLSIVVNDAIRDDLRNSGLNFDLQPDNLSERTATRLQRLISDSFTDTRFVTSICLFDLRMKTYCLGRSDDAGIYEGADKAGRIEASDWYRAAYEAKGKVVYYDSDIFGETDQAFSTVKLFRDADNPGGPPIGLLVVNVSKTIFAKIFGDSNDYGSFMALAETPESAKAVFSNASSVPLGEGGIAEVLDGLRAQGYLINPFRNQAADWTFVHMVKSNELLKQSRNIGWATSAIAAIIAVIALIFSYFISGSITRPLLQVKKMMLDWTKGTRAFPKSFARDEVGVIGETFKRMAFENDELNEKLVHSGLKEREAELRALQSQIKPHFLYNTLDSIYWMAVLQNNRDVAQMAVSLSESFKLSLNKGKETLPVYSELKHIEHYLTIQNIRFNNRFRYIEEIEESILGMEIMKLLLQPLVENAIYHGLEPKLGEGTVRLTAIRDGQYLVFTVEDDGIGMEDLSRTEQGYGLGNVRERLELYYGPDSSLGIWSRPGEGTRITLRFKPVPNPKKTDTRLKNEAVS